MSGCFLLFVLRCCCWCCLSRTRGPARSSYASQSRFGPLTTYSSFSIAILNCTSFRSNLSQYRLIECHPTQTYMQIALTSISVSHFLERVVFEFTEHSRQYLEICCCCCCRRRCRCYTSYNFSLRVMTLLSAIRIVFRSHNAGARVARKAPGTVTTNKLSALELRASQGPLRRCAPISKATRPCGDIDDYAATTVGRLCTRSGTGGEAILFI